MIRRGTRVTSMSDLGLLMTGGQVSTPPETSGDKSGGATKQPDTPFTGKAVKPSPAAKQVGKSRKSETDPTPSEKKEKPAATETAANNQKPNVKGPQKMQSTDKTPAAPEVIDVETTVVDEGKKGVEEPAEEASQPVEPKGNNRVIREQEEKVAQLQADLAKAQEHLDQSKKASDPAQVRLISPQQFFADLVNFQGKTEEEKHDLLGIFSEKEAKRNITAVLSSILHKTGTSILSEEEGIIDLPFEIHRHDDGKIELWFVLKNSSFDRKSIAFEFKFDFNSAEPSGSYAVGLWSSRTAKTWHETAAIAESLTLGQIFLALRAFVETWATYK